VVPAVITVVEAPRNEWRLGGGAGADPAEYQIRARASYAILGWPRPLMNTRLDLRPKVSWLRDATEEVQPGAEASARLERLDLFRPHLRGEALVAFERDAFELYTSYGVRLRLGLDSPIGKRIRAGVGWQFRGLRFDDVNEVVPAETQTALGFGKYYRLAFLEQAISVDLRDDPVQPMFGVYGEIRAEEGGPWAGSEFSYAKITPEIRGYLGQPWAVLAARLRVGTFIGDLPVTQRYFAGGASSQRGFPERRLAPTITGTVKGESESVVIGGGALIETGLELRVPVGTLWGAEIGTAIFADGADVTEDFDQLDPMNLHWATGAGLRLGTPIGPARFDVGRRITRLGDLRPGEKWAFHLSLGHTF
jgi:outer membrane protein assembly factor BamA